MTIGEIIATRRKELGLTLEDIGKAVGVGKSTVKKWESGHISNMRYNKIVPLADILQIGPSVLIGYNINSIPPPTSLSPHEQKLLQAYRNTPSMQEAVNRLLGI